MYRLVLHYKYKKLMREATTNWKDTHSAASHLQRNKNATIPDNYIARNLLVTFAMLALFLSAVFQPVSIKSFHVGLHVSLETFRFAYPTATATATEFFISY